MSLFTNLSATMQLSTVQVDFQIDDNSPLIHYSPPDAWRRLNTSSESIIEKYYGETLTRAALPGAKATFSFNGTGIAIFGGRRKAYSPFTLDVDGTSYTCDASTDGEDLAAVQLCSKYNLMNTNHTATLISSKTAPFDIDKISWTSEINSQHGLAPLETVTVDDNSPTFQYTPPAAWQMNPFNQSQFYGNTGHSTAMSGGSVTYKFTGEIVSIYGTIGPRNAPYTAQLDNHPLAYFNATTEYWTPRSLLFFADNLGPGNHTVTLTNSQAQASGLLLEIDYAEVHRFMPKAVSPVIPSATVSTGSMSQGGNKINIVIILSVIFGTIIASVLVWSSRYLWRRKRDSYARLQEEVKIDNAFDWASASQSLATLHSSDPVTSTHKRGYGYHQASDSMSTLLEMLPLNRQSFDPPGEDPPSRLRPLRLSEKFFGRNRNRNRQTGADSDEAHHHYAQPSLGSLGETELTEEDYGHVPVLGELPPPTYLQAVAPYHLRSLQLGR